MSVLQHFCPTALARPLAFNLQFVRHVEKARNVARTHVSQLCWHSSLMRACCEFANVWRVTPIEEKRTIAKKWSALLLCSMRTSSHLKIKSCNELAEMVRMALAGLEVSDSRTYGPLRGKSGRLPRDEVGLAVVVTRLQCPKHYVNEAFVCRRNRVMESLRVRFAMRRSELE